VLTRSLRRLGLASALALTLSLAMAGCSKTTDNPDTTTSDTGSGTPATEQITLTIGTFNNFGYDKSSSTLQGADLYSKYMALHPEIVIKPTVAATSDDARAAFTTAIGAGSGAYDIQAVDIDWMPFIMDNADKFTDLKSALASNDYLPWKIQQATTPDGKVLGGGTDIGPEGICYRSDLLDAAGIPSDRASVATWLGGANATWESYFNAGKEYVEKSGGKAFFDSSAATYQGMVNQVESSYVDKDSGDIIATTNQQIKDLYDQVTTAAIADKESAGLQQWTDDWNAAFKSSGDNSFATMLCPAWIINNIKNNAGEDFVGWDIADVFPGGGGNWGGSFLIVPTKGKNIQAASDLVAWLTAPEQQAAVFTAASNYPSSPKAETTVANKTEPFLNNAPVGEIFKNRAAAVTVVPYKGSAYFDIQTKMADALNRVDVTKSMSAEDSWNQWISDAKAAS